MENRLSNKKVADLEEKTGRKIKWAYSKDHHAIEFVTMKDEHFLYSKKSETFRQLFGDECRHVPYLCSVME